MKRILTLALIGLFSIGVIAQDRGRHRGHRRVYRPIIVQPTYRPVYQPTYRRAVKVVVYLDSFGRVLYTDTNFADNLYVSERYIIEADRRARAKYYRPGRDRKKTVYIYFSY